MKNKVYEQSFSHGAAVLLFSTVLVKLISAFFKIPLSQDYCLGNIGFGYFSFSYDIYIPIYTLAASGFPVAISKIMSDYTADNKPEKALKAFRIYRNIMLTLGIGGFIAVLVLAKPIAALADKTGNSAYTMLAMAPAVMFCCLSSAYRGAYESKCNMTPTAVSNLIEALAKVFLGFVSAYVTVRLTGNIVLGSFMAMAGISIGTVISFIYLKISYKRRYKDNTAIIQEKSKLLKKLILVSFPIVFSAFAGSVISLIDALTVNIRLSGIIEVSYDKIISSLGLNQISALDSLPTYLYGIRSKAYTIYHLVPTFVSSLAISAIPLISSAYSAKKSREVSLNISSLIKFSSIITFPLGFGMIFVSRPVMSLLFGDNTAYSGGKLLFIYGFAAIFSGITVALTAVLQSTDKQNIGFLNYFIGLVLKLIFNIVLIGIPSLNIYGAALSTVICYLFVMTADIIVLIKSKLISNTLNTIAKPLISAVLCGITARLFTFISSSAIFTLIGIFAGGAVYLFSLFLLKTFVSSDFSGMPLGEKVIKIFKLS